MQIYTILTGNSQRKADEIRQSAPLKGYLWRPNQLTKLLKFKLFGKF